MKSRRRAKIIVKRWPTRCVSAVRSGMTFSFHHHLRNGDYVVNMVMKAARLRNSA